mmetsp:Transcript_70907/g.140674  ORF Transcript_70907/g.140674 Transcript_70907/m.140674 type:complete len:202 (-) Transcript_70907:355-960(-)
MCHRKRASLGRTIPRKLLLKNGSCDCYHPGLGAQSTPGADMLMLFRRSLQKQTHPIRRNSHEKPEKTPHQCIAVSAFADEVPAVFPTWKHHQGYSVSHVGVESFAPPVCAQLFLEQTTLVPQRETSSAQRNPRQLPTPLFAAKPISISLVYLPTPITTACFHLAFFWKPPNTSLLRHSRTANPAAFVRCSYHPIPNDASQV